MEEVHMAGLDSFLYQSSFDTLQYFYPLIACISIFFPQYVPE